jgi:hypothetical protein
MARRVKTRALQLRDADPSDGSVPILFSPRSYDKKLMAAFGIDPATGRPRTRMGTWEVHRGGGKTLVVIAAVLVPAMLHMPGTYFHVFPTYQQAKKAVWDKMFDEGPQIGRPYLDFFRPFAESFNETELQITFRPVNDQRSGSIYQLIGMDTPRQVDLLRSTGPLGIVYDEYQLMERYAYNVLAARMAQTKGFVLFVGTPNGDGAFKDQCEYCERTPGCFHETLTIDQTRKDAPGEDGGPVIGPEEVEHMRAQGIPDQFIKQELYCSRTGYLLSTIFGEAIMRARAAGHITQVPWNKELPVKTAWDIGYDTTAIWFYQWDGHRFCFIDYAARKGDDAEMAKMIHLVKEEKPYVYNDHLAPWDIESKSWGNKYTRKEVARQLGIQFRVCPKASIQDGVDAGRRIMERCVFDETKCNAPQGECSPGLDGLGKYRFPYDDDKKVFGSEPVHDRASHAGSAFRYFAIRPCESNERTGEDRLRPAHNVTVSDVLAPLTARRPGYNRMTVDVLNG